MNKTIKRLFKYISPNISQRKIQKQMIGCNLGKNVRIFGIPRIQVDNDTLIHIGDDVVLNSEPKGYHAGMSFPVTLTADKKGAQIFIGANSRLHGCCIHSQSKISIGRNCLIASGAQLIDSNGHATEMALARFRTKIRDIPEPIEIGDNVWICINVIILKNVKIGEGCIISANSVIAAGEYPPFSLIGGNPGKIIKTYDCNEILSENTLLESLEIEKTRLLLY